MKLYDLLSRISFLRKHYSLKFLFVAFIGIHVPLIGIIVFITGWADHVITPLTIIVLTLILTLLATALTLYVLNGLMVPLIRAKDALTAYVETGAIPELPRDYRDEAGILMNSVQYTIEKLDRLNAEKNDLVSLLSHDIRTPVSQIIMLCDLIDTEEDLVKIKEYVAQIDYLADNQLKVVESIFLILKHSEYSITTKEFRTVHMKQLIDRIIEEVEAKARRKNILLQNRLDSSMMINIKEKLFERVVHNLLINAIKFSYSGQEVTITAEYRDGKVLVHITDQGIGFSPSIAERLFDRFTPFGRKGTSDEPSEGLGLYLSRKIIEQHKGKLYGFSEGPNKGSVFTLELIR